MEKIYKYAFPDGEEGYTARRIANEHGYIWIDADTTQRKDARFCRSLATGRTFLLSSEWLFEIEEAQDMDETKSEQDNAVEL